MPVVTGGPVRLATSVDGGTVRGVMRIAAVGRPVEVHRPTGLAEDGTVMKGVSREVVTQVLESDEFPSVCRVSTRPRTVPSSVSRLEPVFRTLAVLRLP